MFLGDLLGMKYYPVLWGFFKDKLNYYQDPYLTTSVSWKVSACFFVLAHVNSLKLSIFNKIGGLLSSLDREWSRATLYLSEDLHCACIDVYVCKYA